jgi:hypothetical protein
MQAKKQMIKDHKKINCRICFTMTIISLTVGPNVWVNSICRITLIRNSNASRPLT